LFVEYIEYASCFEEKNIFIEYNFTCRNIAQMKVQLEPGYDYCKSVVLRLTI